jgi:hypothetical protein
VTGGNKVKPQHNSEFGVHTPAPTRNPVESNNRPSILAGITIGLAPIRRKYRLKNLFLENKLSFFIIKKSEKIFFF